MPQVCLLLEVLLPLPAPDAKRVLARIAYTQRRNARAARSHHKRKEAWRQDFHRCPSERVGKPIAPPRV